MLFRSRRGIRTVNMLGCHDGIPLLDLKGLLPEERIQGLIDLTVQRGGYVKNLHGAKNMYYQVNATYFSALGESPEKMALARAIQLFMPGKPQVWYLDLLCGKNDYAAMERAGEGGHKEINRTNLSLSEAEARLSDPCVLKQLELLRLRATDPAFSADSKVTARAEGSYLTLAWQNGAHRIALEVDFQEGSWRIVR